MRGLNGCLAGGSDAARFFCAFWREKKPPVLPKKKPLCHAAFRREAEPVSQGAEDHLRRRRISSPVCGKQSV